MTSLWSDEQEQPLQHLRVIDMTILTTGPFVTRFLAQYGADIIKIEQFPEGDPLRKMTHTALFELLNRGKRSVAVNLNTDEGIDLIRKLAGEADVFVENFREGILDKIGLGYVELSEENPDLLYASLRGFSGKTAVQPGNDLNFIASSGCGEWYLENGPHYGEQLGNMVGGAMVPAIKLLSHLANPARRGMHLVSHIDENFRALYLPRAFDTLKAESLEEGKRAGFGAYPMWGGSLPHSRFYRCRDGQWLSLDASIEKHWNTFCDVVDRAEWKARRTDTTLVAELEKLFLDAPSTYWETLAANRDACLVRVLPWQEYLSFSQARPQLAVDPLTWAGFAPNAEMPPCPPLGNDSFSVIHSLGVSNKDISELIKNGTLFQP